MHTRTDSHATDDMHAHTRTTELPGSAAIHACTSTRCAGDAKLQQPRSPSYLLFVHVGVSVLVLRALETAHLQLLSFHARLYEKRL